MGDNQGRTFDLQSIREAAVMRQRAGLGLSDPIDLYRFVEEQGVEVRFTPISTMEGIYLPEDPPTILLPSGRPQGRQVFSCAHEFGHHVFCHGVQMDPLVEGDRQLRSDLREERTADLFAAFLLMPKAAVTKGFQDLGRSTGLPRAKDVLLVANWLGVGYSALLTQMSLSLNMMSWRHAKELKRISPRQIGAEILGRMPQGDLLVVTEHWGSRPMDLRVGMELALPIEGRFEGEELSGPEEVGQFSVFQAIRPGIGRVFLPGRDPAFVRVSRRAYEGLSQYQFLRDPDHE